MHLPLFPQFRPDSSISQRPTPDTLVKIASGNREELENLSLLLSAMSIDHVVDHAAQALLVRSVDVERALYLWQQYAVENSNWPAPLTHVASRSSWFPTFCMMALLFLFYLHTGSWLDGNIWFVKGAIDSVAIEQNGEWWRLLTALTLHMDISHVVGNLLLGGLIIHLLCTQAGYGTAWLLMLVGAVVANFLNITLRDIPHHSVGLSTAVFTALGMLSVIQKRRGQRGRILPTQLISLGAGLALFAMLGSGGERTDLGAHIFGFFCGILLGFLYRLWPQKTPGQLAAKKESLYFTLALVSVLIAWARAMH